MSFGATPNSCCSAPRDHRAAVCWYSGTPTRLPLRSPGASISAPRRTSVVVWKKRRVVNTGMPTKRSSPLDLAIISEDIDISATSNSANRSCRQNNSDGCNTVGTRSIPSGLTAPSMIGQVRGFDVMPRLNWSFMVCTLPKPRRALLAEGAAALLGFLGAVIERHRLEAERAHAPELLGICIERALGDRQRRGAAFLELGAPAVDLLVEPLGRHHRVDQAHVEGFLRAVAPAQIPDFPRALLADQPRQIGGAEAGINRPDLGPDLPEHRLLGGDGQVAQRRQHVAAADRDFLGAGDHRLGHVADERLQLVDRQADGAAAAVAAFMRALVGAGAEGAVAGAGQHDDGDALVRAGATEGVDQFLAGLRREGIVLLGPVDGDARDAVANVEEDVPVGVHVASPCACACPCSENRFPLFRDM